MTRSSGAEPIEGARPVRWRRCAVAVGLAVLGWLTLRGVSSRPELVERFYSEGIFPAVRDVLRAVSGVSPVSLAELLLFVLGVWVLWLVVSAARLALLRRRPVRNLLLRGSTRAITWAGFGYFVFLLVWGFNHARRPYAWHAGLEVAPVTREELIDLGSWLVLECNRLGEVITDADLELEAGPGGVDPALLAGYEALGEEVPTLRAGAPLLREPWISPILSAGGISGIYSPFTAEAHLNRDIPAWSRPFAAGHEIAHLKGFAREDEAHCIAWQACRRSGDAGFEYSASMVALGEVLVALASVDPAAAGTLLGRLGPRGREDRRVSHEFWSSQRGPWMDFSTATNDAYLRSQGQEAGVKSYGRMVDLLVAERK